MSLSQRIARGVKATFGAELVHLGAQAGIILLLTRMLGPDGYGTVYLAISVFSVASLFGTVGIPKSTAKFVTEYAQKDRTQVRHIVRRSTIALVFTTGIVCLVYFALIDPIVAVYDEPALGPLLVLGTAYIAINVAYGYVTILFQGFGKVPLTGVTRAVANASQFGAIVLLLVLGFGTVGVIGGFVIGYAIAVLIASLYAAKILRTYPRTESAEPGLTRRVLEYSVPLTASQAGNVLYKRVDTLMVGFFLTPVAVGFYELAKQVSTFVIAPADSLGFTVAPTFGEHKSSAQLERAARVYEQSLEYILLLYLPAVVGVVLLAEPGIRFVFGSAYLGAVPVLQIFSVFILFQAVDKITNDSLDYLGRATERAIGKGVTGTANFCLNVALIPLIGVEGAALSTAVCFALMVLYNLYLIDSELDLHWGTIAKSFGVTGGITAAMTAAVYALAPFISGLFTLFGVVAFGILVWALCSVASGVVDVGEVKAHI